MKHHIYDKPIANKYQIRGKVKSGGFGSVYLAKGINGDTQQYAVKFIPKKYKKYAEIQFEIYEKFQSHQYTHGFVKQFQHGKFESEYFIAMELLHYDLEQLLIKNKGRFSVKSALMVALQLIDRIEALHKIGYIHRDIKPDNMAVGMKDKKKTIYLIDFGLSKDMSSPLSPDQKGKMIGTLGFMSCRCHQGKPLTQLDDMESFLYSIIYMIKGDLPWMKMNISSKADYHKIKLMKEKLGESWFKSNKIPLELYQSLKQIRQCSHPKQLDYLKCKFKIIKALQNLHLQNDFLFDWCSHHHKPQVKIEKEQKKTDTKQKRVEEYKQQIQGKHYKRPMTANKRSNSPKIEEQMHKENKQIIDKEVYEIYKFLEKEEKPSPKKQKPQQKVMIKQQKKLVQQQQKANPKRPASVGPKKKIGQYPITNINRDLQKKIGSIGMMKMDGPRIAINHQKL